MASVVVSVNHLKRGDLPAVCAKTGAPCENAVRLKLRVCGNGALGAFVTERRLSSIVPIVARRTALVRRLAELAWVALAACFVGAGWAIDRGGTAAAALALAGLVAYIALLLAGSRLWIGAITSAERTEVMLTRVHPNFVRAVGAEASARH